LPEAEWTKKKLRELKQQKKRALVENLPHDE
jgi:hypothetical protein